MTSRFRFLVGGLFVAAPLGALGSGCSGGSNGGSPVSPTNTPIPTATTTGTPTATTTPTATPTQTAAQTSNITLGNGQRAILTTRTRGTSLTGTIEILASPVPLARHTKALSFNIAVGTYAITGSFTPPRGYQISGNFGTTGAFTMSGQLPTTTQNGSYSLTVNGQTEAGVVPKIGQTFPTPTPTVKPTTQPGNSFHLTFTPSSDSNFVGAPLIKTTATLVSSVNIAGFTVQSDNQFGKDIIFLAATGLNASVGSALNYPSSTGNYIYNYTPTGTIRVFIAQSGSITLTKLTSDSATFTLKDVVYVANSGNIATGKVTVNGTLTSPLTRY